MNRRTFRAFGTVHRRNRACKYKEDAGRDTRVPGFSTFTPGRRVCYTSLYPESGRGTMSGRSVGRLLGLFGLINLLLIGWGMARGRQPGELRVTFLDVGQGDAAIIESPSGKTLVVDTGGVLPNGDDEG